jgi:hypothetical protein
MNAPIKIGNERSNTCAVSMLKKGEQIEMKGILNLVYPGDTFYWGTVEGDLQKCLPQH